MRHGLIAALLLTILIPRAIFAQSTAVSRAWVAHAALTSGQQETLHVVARDLSGSPLAGASVKARVQYAQRTISLQAPATDAQGGTSVTFVPPSGAGSGRALVHVLVSKGYLRIPLTTSFVLRQATPLPGTLLIVMTRIVPEIVQAPDPAWLVVYAQNRSGTGLSSATVRARVVFGTHSTTLSGTTDKSGVATLKLDTRGVMSPGNAEVVTEITWRGKNASAAGQFSVATAAPTASPTTAPTPTAAATPPQPVPVASSTPVPTPAPAPVPTAVPTVGSALTATPTPTLVASQQSPTPTNTPVLPTSTPVPTFTPVVAPTDGTSVPSITPSPTPTLTPGPTATPTAPAPCPGSVNGHDGCMDAMVNIINQSRLQYNLGPLQLNVTQSLGNGSCVGSFGHSRAMADSGTIWHENPNYPQASFPNDLCFGLNGAENVGYSATGNEQQDLQTIESIMMQEPHDPFPQACRGVISHVCNILTTQHTQVGIGIVQSGGRTYVTEDFVN